MAGLGVQFRCEFQCVAAGAGALRLGGLGFSGAWHSGLHDSCAASMMQGSQYGFLGVQLVILKSPQGCLQ